MKVACVYLPLRGGLQEYRLAKKQMRPLNFMIGWQPFAITLGLMRPQELMEYP